MNIPQTKLRLLVISPSTERGGAEEYVLTLTSAAVEKGWDVHVAFPKREKTVSLVKSFEEKGVSYHPLEIEDSTILKFKTIKKYLPHLTQTVRLLLKNKPDVVQIVLPQLDLCLGSILACGLLKIPTGVVFQLAPTPISYNQGRLKLYQWARDRNQQWIAVSKHNRKVISESFQFPREQVRCIYNGSKAALSVNNFNNEEINNLRRQIKQELNLPETSRLALTVGRLESQKGHVDLIPAIPHLVKEFPDVRFVWIGDGKEREDILQKVREYGIEDKVLFLGYRSDVPKLLVSADLFLFPTRFEGQPFALMEAMAHGLPVVTSDACGIPELIENRVHGLLFRTGDSCDLLEATRWALRHPEQMQQMAENARLRVQIFSEQRMVEETLDLLQKLSDAPKQVNLTKSNSSQISPAKALENQSNKPIKVQIFSRHIPIQNTVGNATYILDFIRYLHHAGCEIEYTVLSSSPNGGIPFCMIPSTLAAIATVSAKNNLRIGRVLLRFNSLSQWLLAPLQLAYRQLPNNWKSFYRAAWNKLRKKREDAISQRLDAPRIAPQPWDTLATPEEVAFANSRFVSFQPDVVIANYTWLGSLLDALPQKQSVLKAILTHDILHQRVADFRKIGVDSHLCDWNWDNESALLRKAQVLLAIQEQEAEILKEMAPSTKVISMPMSVVCHVHQTQQVHGRCLFVGSGSPHNVYGLRWLLESVWPLVLQTAPNCSLHICGDVCEQIQVSFPNVRLLGRVADLKPEYGAAQVCMVPLLMGSGLKIKLVEALSYGRACVSTGIGVQGLGDIVGHAVLVAETAEEFAAAIHTLITNPDKRKWMEAQAHQYVKEKLSPEAVYQPFLNQIEQHIQQVTNSVLE